MFSRILLRNSFKTIRPNFLFNFKFCSQPKQELNQDLVDEIETDIFALLKSKDKCQVGNLSRTVTFEELGFDSLDSVEIVVEMEEVLNVDLENDEAEKIKSVHDAIMTFYNHKANPKTNSENKINVD